MNQTGFIYDNTEDLCSLNLSFATDKACKFVKISPLSKFIYEFGPLFGITIMLYGFILAFTGYWLLDLSIFLNISSFVFFAGTFLCYHMFGNDDEADGGIAVWAQITMIIIWLAIGMIIGYLLTVYKRVCAALIGMYGSGILAICLSAAFLISYQVLVWCIVVGFMIFGLLYSLKY